LRAARNTAVDVAEPLRLNRASSRPGADGGVVQDGKPTATATIRCLIDCLIIDPENVFRA